MILTWWKTWSLTHMHACVETWWMVSFPYWMLIPSLFFRAPLDPHKKENAEASMRLV